MRQIPLFGKKASGRVALVDDEDYDLLTQYRWRVWEFPRATAVGGVRGPYAVANISRRPVRMHNLILGRPWVDHINHNGLDNRRHNLRPTTAAENLQNSRSRQGSSSQYKGVTWCRRGRKWQAAIRLGRSVYLGRFVSEEAAARAYDAAAAAAFGENACLNFPRVRESGGGDAA